MQESDGSLLKMNCGNQFIELCRSQKIQFKDV